MSLLFSRLGLALRETGQALERVGYDLAWVHVGLERYREPLCRSQRLSAVNGHAPEVAKDAFVAPGANITGKVYLGSGASVFYNCVVRGDAAPVIIGKGSNVQDGSTIGTAVSGINQKERPVIIGENVTIGHAATLRGCIVEDTALIGMGACVMEGATVQRGAMVAAGAVVHPNVVVPSGELWGGKPARFLRKLKPAEEAFLPVSAESYVEVAKEHKKDCAAASAHLPK